MKAINVLLMGILVLCVLPLANAEVPVDSKTRGELAELGLHKLERLTAGTAPRVDKSFQGQTLEVQVALVSAGNYAVSYLQGLASDGNRKTLTINMIDTGSVTGFTANEANAPANPLNFTTLNALTLLENSLHCVEGEIVGSSPACANSAGLKPFKEKLKQALLKPIQDASGASSGASVELYGIDLTQKAVITLKADGSLSDENPIQFINL